jgi:hypothetical protein
MASIGPNHAVGNTTKNKMSQTHALTVHDRRPFHAIHGKMNTELYGLMASDSA